MSDTFNPRVGSYVCYRSIPFRNEGYDDRGVVTEIDGSVATVKWGCGDVSTIHVSELRYYDFPCQYGDRWIHPHDLAEGGGCD